MSETTHVKTNLLELLRDFTEKLPRPTVLPLEGEENAATIRWEGSHEFAEIRARHSFTGEWRFEVIHRTAAYVYRKNTFSTLKMAAYCAMASLPLIPPEVEEMHLRTVESTLVQIAFDKRNRPHSNPAVIRFQDGTEAEFAVKHIEKTGLVAGFLFFLDGGREAFCPLTTGESQVTLRDGAVTKRIEYRETPLREYRGLIQGSDTATKQCLRGEARIKTDTEACILDRWSPDGAVIQLQRPKAEPGRRKIPLQLTFNAWPEVKHITSMDELHQEHIFWSPSEAVLITIA